MSRMLMLVFVPFVLLLLPVAAIAQGESEELTGQIVYTSDETGRNDTYVIDLATGEITNLTNTPDVAEYNPQLPYSGRKMTYASHDIPTDTATISERDFVSDEITERTKGGPDWDPDYCRIPGDGRIVIKSRNEIVILYPDDTISPPLTATIAEETWDGTFNPDCTKVAFTRGLRKDADLCVVDITVIDPENPVEPTCWDHPNKPEWYASWTKDGTQILFDSLSAADSPTKDDVFIMNADGTNIVQLTDGPCDDNDPAFNHDETLIVYVENCGSNWHLNLMNADGSNIRTILEVQGATGILGPVFMPPA